ncbi:unnamed protein product, partial [Diplocarpon coronariae]
MAEIRRKLVIVGDGG